MSQVIENQRLTAYLDTDPKYQIAPIPAPIDSKAAIEFVQNHVNERQDPGRIAKLARLVILHDLRETAPAFAAVLNNKEEKTLDYYRSAWALIALAWIGSQDQVRSAQAYLHQLQARADVWKTRLLMLDATEAFGPAERTDKHRAWVQEEIGHRKSLLSQYKAQNKQNEARGVQIQIDELEEHLNLRVAAVDRSNAIRSSVLGSPIDARISRIAALYLGTEPATPTLSSWAAFTLVRVAKQDNANAAKIGAQFAIVARQHERPAGEENLQFTLIRARSLRAVEFFGQAVGNGDRQWLRNQADPGTDLLALRPDWNYR